jgi:ADP-ribose pyrophosphatase
MSPYPERIQRPEPKQRPPTSAVRTYKGVLFEVWQWQQKLFNGETALFEVLRRPDTVLVLPVVGNDVLLVEERQPGMKSMLRTLGGRVESGETPEQAAQRELREESGFTANTLLLWDAWQPVNKIDWAVFLFVAHGLVERGKTSLDAGEAIALRRVPLASILDGKPDVHIDDYELMHKVYQVRSDEEERLRAIAILSATQR